MDRIRLDQLLLDRGLAESRSRARALIMEGRVFSGERRLEKPGMLVPSDLPLEVRQPRQWVSRGGDKLAHALQVFGIDPRGRIALDVGASTGGFTHVLLHHGARRVYAVDVGYGQLDWRLRQDPRVVVLERTNARYLDRTHVPEPVELVVCDASFISLTVLLPAPLALTTPEAELVALIKPQFEVGRGRVGRGGVVRDPTLHQEACAKVRRFLESLREWRVVGIVPSPLLGPRGNREFLLYARREPMGFETNACEN